ncbi:hypothetical protein [Nocardioides sp. NPDC127503]|uniref:hypothetical protein n=1 Tax=Nocardioides sp. NPDC127503 TaxID=3154516 RepID=UPI003328E13F
MTDDQQELTKPRGGSLLAMRLTGVKDAWGALRRLLERSEILERGGLGDEHRGVPTAGR